VNIAPDLLRRRPNAREVRPADERFHSQVSGDPTIRAGTEIFLPPFRYPQGYTVTAEPPRRVQWREYYRNKLCVAAMATATYTSACDGAGRPKIDKTFY
jgi:hypothetical protein